MAVRATRSATAPPVTTLQHDDARPLKRLPAHTVPKTVFSPCGTPVPRGAGDEPATACVNAGDVPVHLVKFNELAGAPVNAAIEDGPAHA
ncbi:hypothetical protein M8494_22095 [Serratia ureilytica]